MKSSILTIFKKELARFFFDKRLVFSILLLPGLMIFFMYSFMGSMIKKEIGKVEEHKALVYFVNSSSKIEKLVESLGMEVVPIGEERVSEVIEKIREKEADLLILFDEGFDEKVESYNVKEGKKAPELQLYFNSSKNESDLAHQNLMMALGRYEESISNKFDINRNQEVQYDLATKEDITGRIFGGMMPMLLMIFMWSGCMSVAPESIAGEKERGTIATLLVTPTRRSDLALGKILALSFIAFLSGVSSFTGTFASFPKLMQGMEGGLNFSYQPLDFVMLFLVIVSTVLVMVALISIISGFAKSVKEAATLASPVMILIMIISFLPGIMNTNEAREPLHMFFLPLYNSVLSMHEVFKSNYDVAHILTTAFVNFFFAILLAGGLTKLFNSEKIMFSK